MFRQITIITSSDNQGHQYTGIRRSDNHGKLGYTGNHCGDGRLYRSGNVERVARVLRGMGYHRMYGTTYGKLFA